MTSQPKAEGWRSMLAVRVTGIRIKWREVLRENRHKTAQLDFSLKKKNCFSIILIPLRKEIAVANKCFSSGF